ALQRQRFGLLKIITRSGALPGNKQLPIAVGQRNACQRKQNGRRQDAVPVRLLSFIPGAPMPPLVVVRTAFQIRIPIQLAAYHSTRACWESLIWWAMSGNGQAIPTARCQMGIRFCAAAGMGCYWTWLIVWLSHPMMSSGMLSTQVFVARLTT